MPPPRLTTPSMGACVVRSLLLLTLAPCRAGGLLLEGWVPAKANFQEFLGKFVVVNDITGDVVANAKTKVHPLGVTKVKKGQLHVLVYDDEEDHWQHMKDRLESSTCEEKLEAASWIQNVTLSEGDWEGDFHVVQKIRPRFWYFTLVGCNMPADVPLRYSIQVTNDKLGWQKETSFDHKDLVTLNAIFSLAFAITSFVVHSAMKGMAVPQKGAAPGGSAEHPYLRLLLTSQVAATASSSLFALHDFFFLRSGLGSKRLEFLAAMAATVSTSTVFLIVVLASTGWAITASTLPNRRVFLGMVAVVGGLSALCELHAEVTVTQSSELYTYQSFPGLLSLVLKAFVFAWFCIQLWATHSEEWHPRRQAFYKGLGAVTALLALHTPVGVVLSYMVSPWYRYRVVAIVDLCARWVGQAALACLLLGGLSPISAQSGQPGEHGTMGSASDMAFRTLSDDGERPSLSI